MKKTTRAKTGTRRPAAPRPPALRLHGLFTDRMVLQRDRAAPVWGTARPGAEVTVRFAGRAACARAGRDGAWRAWLPPVPAGGPHELRVESEGARLRLRDVLSGDVWICSGQSNMEWPLQQARDAEREIAAARHPAIRLFTVARRVSASPCTDVDGPWRACEPAAASGFSAVGYFFGRALREALDVPIGLINASWGGTPAEAWTDAETYAADPAIRALFERQRRLMSADPAAMKKYNADLARWKSSLRDPDRQTDHDDPGNRGYGKGWASPDFDDADWPARRVPGYWEQQGMAIDGAVWFRREVEIPAAWAGRDLVLALGPIDDFDETYVNGARVGATGLETPGFWAHPREYAVPGKLTKAGRAVIAVRVFDRGGNGGFGGRPECLALRRADGGGDAIPLAGDWKHRVELQLPQRPAAPFGPDNPHYPCGLYNGMIRPLVPFGVRGAIWYQGETNASRHAEYRALLSAMIGGWRRAWGQGEFPFLIVQLANYMAAAAEPGESDWAALREAQAQVAQRVPHGGLAVAIDVGAADDIHPRDKQSVGARLALAAREVAYGEGPVGSGPVFRRAAREGDRLRLFFDHTGGGLVARGGPLKSFAIAGEDGAFVWAEARIEGDTVVVWSPRVPRPAAARYAWADNPAGANLCRAEDLPAVPFRTDAPA